MSPPLKWRTHCACEAQPSSLPLSWAPRSTHSGLLGHRILELSNSRFIEIDKAPFGAFVNGPGIGSLVKPGATTKYLLIVTVLFVTLILLGSLLLGLLLLVLLANIAR